MVGLPAVEGRAAVALISTIAAARPMKNYTILLSKDSFSDV
jgi:hypothetical protein